MTSKFDADKPIFVMPNLKGPEGNAFNLLGKAQVAFKEHGSPQALRNSFSEEAMSGDYNHLLNTILLFFNVVQQAPHYVVVESAEQLGHETETDE